MVSYFEIINELIEFGYSINDEIYMSDFRSICENLGVHPSDTIKDKVLSMYHLKFIED